jgi:hypothetical protein
MKKRTLAVTLTLASLMATACGTPGSGSGGGGPVVPSSGAQSPSSNSTSNSAAPANNSAGSSSQSNSLTPFQEGAKYGITVDIPNGWVSKPMKGNGHGDTTGWTITDASDPTSQIVVATSGCVGCYMGSNGQPNPQQVIPVTGATVTSTSANGNTVHYTFSPSGSSNEGWGELTTSNNASGYAYVDVVLPSSESSLAQSILQSFQMSN